MVEEAMLSTCARCKQPATYDPARGGTITAQPCGHVITLEEAVAAFPERWAALFEETPFLLEPGLRYGLIEDPSED